MIRERYQTSGNAVVETDTQKIVFWCRTESDAEEMVRRLLVKEMGDCRNIGFTDNNGGNPGAF